MGWPWRKNTSRNEVQLGIWCQAGQFAAVGCQNGEPVLFFPATDGDDASEAALAGWIQQNQLERSRTVLLMPNNGYQLHLMQAPDVEDHELAGALRFGLGDLVNQPLEQLVVEAFRLPDDAYRGRNRIAQAVVCERSFIKDQVDWCKRMNLSLQQILIGELALLNLLALLEPEGSVGILVLNEHDGRLTLYREGALYLSRQLHLGQQELQQSLQADANPDGGLQLVREGDGPLDYLQLEVQRSMDYFDSQMGMGLINQLWLMPTRGVDADLLLERLEQAFRTPWRLLSVPGVRRCERQLLALAGALQLPHVDEGGASWL
ncbi:hypothetical protein [Parathalassolituus penaei]|uniref:MSHA biogenesis protein MshI n=1 Tax=Parathalassolituus penaei TaxID=2997323 RepID=A0A9X3ISI1_9GAMM|nr:hypothetical protein [Parathalassolituus penaei]MCY0964178.1 hypothetical protein [Parathalassolituus penaei]